MEGTEIAAPAPPLTAETPAPVSLTAAEQAVVSDNLTAFRDARRAERSGKPLAPAPVADPDPAPVETPIPAAAAPPAPVVSKRQQETNDRIREAVEKATADLQAENARLKAAAPPPRTTEPPPAAAAPAPTAATDDPKPKYEDFATEADPFTAHMEALALWSGRQAYKAAQLDSQKTKHQQDFYAAQERLDAEGLKAHKDFGEKLTALAKSGVVWPPDVSMAILQHPKGAELAYALASDPALSQRVTLFDLGVLAASLATPAAPAPIPPKTVTDAPDPPTVLGARPAEPGDPIARAVNDGDVTAYRTARMAERIALRK